MKTERPARLALLGALAVLAVVVYIFDVGGLRVTLSNRWYEAAHPDVIGGRCLCCEGTLEFPPDEELGPVGTLFDYSQEDSQRIAISGVVYAPGGLSPAPGVILYIFHADRTGRFPQSGSISGCAQVHGALRGWLMTDENGEYTFLTARPGSEGGMYAHIHLYVKEPDKNAYALAEYTFADDPLASGEEDIPRGGSGVLANGVLEDGVLHYQRDIILGLNIPNYP
ncbi:MAG: intradiol ring-cleavage dioxygenase [Chloroflexi bacterium]|nr:intradiol ring-cleavage dioxygenase [Chloroflexota bacterium]